MSGKFIIEIDGKEHEVDVSDELIRAIALMAAQNGLSFAAAFEQAVTDGAFVAQQQKSGARLLIEKNDKLRYLEREATAV